MGNKAKSKSQSGQNPFLTMMEVQADLAGSMMQASMAMMSEMAGSVAATAPQAASAGARPKKHGKSVKAGSSSTAAKANGAASKDTAAPSRTKRSRGRSWYRPPHKSPMESWAELWGLDSASPFFNPMQSSALPFAWFANPALTAPFASQFAQSFANPFANPLAASSAMWPWMATPPAKGTRKPARQSGGEKCAREPRSRSRS